MASNFSQADFAKARRKLKRQIAAAIIQGMADCDMGFEQIAARLDEHADEIRGTVFGLVEGRGTNMDRISDICFAMDAEIDMSFTALRPVKFNDEANLD